ncbi:MAG: DUF3291 domain-containing protein [Cyclobacteriaceae bacterium]
MKHLAQLNIAKLLKPIDHPQIAEFVDNIERINAIAEQSDGFVWRMKDECENALAIKAFDDPMLIINMSVWETAEDLKNYVYNSDHLEIMKKRRNWFEKPSRPPMVLWWINAGEIPSIQDGKKRLELLRTTGESDEALTFKSIINQAS